MSKLPAKHKTSEIDPYVLEMDTYLSGLFADDAGKGGVENISKMSDADLRSLEASLYHESEEQGTEEDRQAAHRHNYTNLLRALRDRQNLLDHTQDLAARDPMTRLFNKVALDDEMKLQRARMNRRQKNTKNPSVKGNGALLIIDLDKFKPVNDNHGHKVGDQVINHVAKTLSKLARESDVVARIGGDEFAVLLTDANEIQAEEALKRFRKGFENLSFETRHSKKGGTLVIDVGASFGMSVFKEGMSVDELMVRADNNMYASKKSKGIQRTHG